MKDNIIEFLKHIGDDFVPEGVIAHAECMEGETCPEHEDCGICRYEYMKGKGWLSEAN